MEEWGSYLGKWMKNQDKWGLCDDKLMLWQEQEYSSAELVQHLNLRSLLAALVSSRSWELNWGFQRQMGDQGQGWTQCNEISSLEPASEFSFPGIV